MNDVDTSIHSTEQGTALQTWVERGGRLVIGGDAGAQHTVAGLPDSLLEFKPHGLVDIDALVKAQPGQGEFNCRSSAAPGLAEFAGAKTIRVPRPFTVATGEANDSQILVQEGKLPLMLERNQSRGYIDFTPLT
jgi:hypothetical protein